MCRQVRLCELVWAKGGLWEVTRVIVSSASAFGSESEILVVSPMLLQRQVVMGSLLWALRRIAPKMQALRRIAPKMQVCFLSRSSSWDSCSFECELWSPLLSDRERLPPAPPEIVSAQEDCL